MKIRIGIDVGGTFTDAVAIDNETLDILGFVKVLTTHHSKNGVADGIVLAISNLVSKYKIENSNIVFISTGTTQATNAILEGDISDVGVVVITNKKKYSIANIHLGNDNYITTKTYPIKPDSNFDINLEKIMVKIKSDNIKSIVASCPFSPDNPTLEKKVLDMAKKYDIYATATYDISQLYGIKMRTNTAIINACILPRMITTINMIETSIKNMGINAPILIMRCDGGVIPIDEVKKRPFLTILSGPAAGVYGALVHEKISSGIFLEVGGTSTDISVIKNGNIMLKHAQIGKHKLYLNSLDIHTIAVAGGSLIKITPNKKLDVGPRSAHILGLKYSCFCEPSDLANSKLILLESEGCKYACIKNPKGKIFAITLTCVLNAMELINSNDYAFGNIDSAKIAISILSDFLNTNDIANKILKIATSKCMPVINALRKQYRTNNLMLFGGGGASCVLVPFIAKKLNCQYKICKDAHVISTIGVALSTVREVIEKTVFNPTQKDIENLKMQAISKIKNSIDSINTYVEFDKSKNILRVTATESTKNISPVSKLNLTKIIANHISCPESLVLMDKQIGKYFIFNAITTKKIMGLIRKEKKLHIVIDSFGIIQFIKPIRKLYLSSNLAIPNILGDLLNKNSTYSDIGKLFPRCTIVNPNKIINLPNFSDMSKTLDFVKSEMDFSNTFDVAILIE